MQNQIASPQQLPSPSRFDIEQGDLPPSHSPVQQGGSVLKAVCSRIAGAPNPRTASKTHGINTAQNGFSSADPISGAWFERNSQQNRRKSSSCF